MVFRLLKLKHIIFIVLLLFYCTTLFAQEATSSKQTLEDLIEDLASSLDENIDYTSLYDDLNFYLNEPLNLNTATIEDLEKLQILNDFQIKSLLDYIHKSGKMLSIYELQLVYGFSEPDITNILPFITVKDISSNETFKLKYALKYGNNQIFLRSQKVLDEQFGYSSISDSALLAKPNSRYLGNSYKIYAKYKYIGRLASDTKFLV